MSRVLPGVVMAACCLALLAWASTAVIQSVFVLVAAVGLFEFFRITSPSLQGSLLYLSIFVALFPVFFVFAGSIQAVLAGTIATILGGVVLSLKNHDRLDNAYLYLSSVVFGAMYVSVSLAHLSLLSTMEYGTSWLLILLGITAGSDTGAYYVGKTFGRKKLMPAISPKKTIAGGVGGVATGTLAAVIFAALLPLPMRFSLLPTVVLLIVIGMMGDLAESAIKRSFDVKDSGTLLAGHGGILDRIDSILLAGPVLFYCVLWGIL
ncbi:MAG: hypothetical protein CSB34_01380 [Desulfobulbus propionicus]|nr:MAG: hypothetical protein CSB34_01380 [Desulfobulbus propionicus]PIE66092.1 MAG: hypothetical protein CSA26_01665 [Desulfobacterales bacterium]